jgi:hypothetical protein
LREEDFSGERGKERKRGVECFVLKETYYLLSERKRVCSFLLFFAALASLLVLRHCLEVPAPVTRRALAWECFIGARSEALG